jgi:ribosomal protein S2
MERQIIEKIAAGLRRVDKTPDYILVDMTNLYGMNIYEQEICGIPLIQICLTGFSQTDDKDCPFIPVYKDIDEMDICNFRRGYDEK